MRGLMLPESQGLIFTDRHVRSVFVVRILVDLSSAATLG
jgi:hypothetical protein